MAGHADVKGLRWYLCLMSANAASLPLKRSADSFKGEGDGGGIGRGKGRAGRGGGGGCGGGIGDGGGIGGYSLSHQAANSGRDGGVTLCSAGVLQRLGGLGEGSTTDATAPVSVIETSVPCETVAGVVARKSVDINPSSSRLQATTEYMHRGDAE